MTGPFLSPIKAPLLLLGAVAFAWLAPRLGRGPRFFLLALVQLASLVLLNIPAPVIAVYAVLGAFVAGGLTLADRASEAAAGRFKASLILALLAVLALLRYEAVARALGLEAQLLDVKSARYWGLAHGLGISYLAFRLIAVVADHEPAKAGQPTERSFGALLAYSLLAPCALAGPITRLPEFHRDVDGASGLDGQAAIEGLTRFVRGLVKKIVVAGSLEFFALGHLPLQGSPFRLAAACAVYSAYIYFDFSGYTDISLGWARLAGLRLAENFDRPYLARNLQDFWNRWHMSLSSWLKAYLFYPLNLSLTRAFPRGARVANPMLALLVTFTLAGVWHGDGLGFLLFGLMHGLGLAFLRVLEPKERSGPSFRLPLLAGRLLTFAYVSLCWIPFVYSPQEFLREFHATSGDVVLGDSGGQAE